MKNIVMSFLLLGVISFGQVSASTASLCLKYAGQGAAAKVLRLKLELVSGEKEMVDLEVKESDEWELPVAGLKDVDPDRLIEKIFARLSSGKTGEVYITSARKSEVFPPVWHASGLFRFVEITQEKGVYPVLKNTGPRTEIRYTKTYRGFGMVGSSERTEKKVVEKIYLNGENEEWERRLKTSFRFNGKKGSEENILNTMKEWYRQSGSSLANDLVLGPGEWSYKERRGLGLQVFDSTGTVDVGFLSVDNEFSGRPGKGGARLGLSIEIEAFTSATSGQRQLILEFYKDRLLLILNEIVDELSLDDAA